MDNFAAIDFETANSYPTSICSVGIIIVKNGITVDSYYSLVKPEPNEYYYHNFCVHGIKFEDTEDAPIFPDVWEEIEPMIEGLPLVAHNKRFDEKCLKKTLESYRITYPDYEFHCTYAASHKQLKGLVENFQLHTVAAYCGFNLKNHHNALADAEACAEIAKKLL